MYALKEFIWGPVSAKSAGVNRRFWRCHPIPRSFRAYISASVCLFTRLSRAGGRSGVDRLFGKTAS